jgi:hypothetical protein
VRVLVRSYDREHALKLAAAGVEYQIRETFESAVRLGESALLALGVSSEEAAEIALDVRRRTLNAFRSRAAVRARRSCLVTRRSPRRFTTPQGESRTLSEETALVTQEELSGAADAHRYAGAPALGSHKNACAPRAAGYCPSAMLARHVVTTTHSVQPSRLHASVACLHRHQHHAHPHSA